MPRGAEPTRIGADGCIVAASIDLNRAVVAVGYPNRFAVGLDGHRKGTIAGFRARERAAGECVERANRIVARVGDVEPLSVGGERERMRILTDGERVQRDAGREIDRDHVVAETVDGVADRRHAPLTR